MRKLLESCKGKKILSYSLWTGALTLSLIIFYPFFSFAIEKAPRISDKEIVERLTRLEEGQKRLEKRIDDLDSTLNKRIDDTNRRIEDLRSEMNGKFAGLRSEMNGKFADLRSEMNGKFADLRSEMNGKFSGLRSEMNGRFKSIDKRLDILQWMFGLFITISIVVLGFVLRMQWQMNKRQTSMETAFEAQKEELAFIKGLIEKFLPPKGVL